MYLIFNILISILSFNTGANNVGIKTPINGCDKIFKIFVILIC